MKQPRTQITICRVVAAGLALCLLTACSSSPAHTTTAVQRLTSSTSTAPAPVATTTTPPPPQGGASAVGTATDSGGDTVEVGIALQHAVVASSLSNDAVQQCAERLQASGSSLDRSLAIPFNVRIRITSSLSTQVQVDLGTGLSQVASGGTIQLPDQMPFWAINFSDGAVCEAPGDYTYKPGVNTWTTPQPDTSYNGNGWIILTGAITPDDPDGTSSYVGQLLLSPLVRLGNNNAQFTLNPTTPGVVSCYLSDPAAGRTTYMAYQPSAAIALGCTAG